MQRELEVALAAAREAGRAIARVYAKVQGAGIDVTAKSGDRGPLTEADLAADEILRVTLTSAFPEDGWLSEETADAPSRLARPRCWIVDPLDGTREFTLGLPEFVVSIGLAIRGEARLGVVHQPITGLTVAGYIDDDGVGHAFTTDGPARTTARRTLDGARLLVSRNELEKGGFGAWAGRITLEPLGSVAYKLALVAIGQADATFTPKPRNEWDLCGGVAVVRAAGGRCSDGSGADYRFNQPNPLRYGVVGTNGPLHDAVLGLMS